MNRKVSASANLWIACIALAYLSWSAFWIGTCMYPIGEECVSAAIVLYVSGFPLALVAEPFGGGMGQVVAAAVLGTTQWGAIAALFLRRRVIRQNAG